MSYGNIDPFGLGYRKPLSPGYRRPEPWVLDIAPGDRNDPDGLDHKPGIKLVVDEGYGRKSRSLTKIEIYKYAAHKIIGGSVFCSANERYLDEEHARYNREVHKKIEDGHLRAAYLHRAVIVCGVSPEQFEMALAETYHDAVQLRMAEEATAREADALATIEALHEL